MISQLTMTFRLPGFFSVVGDLENFPTVPGDFNEPQP